MKRFFKFCSVIFVLGTLALVIGYLLLAPRVTGLLAGLFASPTPPSTSGLAGYILQSGDLPEGARVLQYQEVPHPECTDYAVSYTIPDGLQIYSKICCTASPGRIADLSQQWPDTVRVDAPTVGQESMTFHGPVIGKPAVTVVFIQGQCSGMVQVIGNDDAATTEFAVHLALTVAERVPLTTFPTLTGTQQAECYKTMELSVSNKEFGEPVTTFHAGDGIFPMVSNPIECGQGTVRLIDSGNNTVMEKTYSVAGGMNGYGDYNAARALAPGDYKMELWYGELLLKTINLTVN
ncbi:MAG: hypothetical protein Q7U34_03180 [Anaerolineales bacterium]|nr:hypothetical protein [Anaerolineales bacterium]